MGFRFEIDTKSLYLGVRNDSLAGHTPTVSTNLRQGSTTKQELRLFQESDSNISLIRKDRLIELCLYKSKSLCKITNILVFDKIFVNGVKIPTKSQFCIYLKQEVDPSKYHFGRIKLHYPMSLAYSDYDLDISNKDVLNDIKSYLQGYAYLVRAFEIREKGEINFETSIIGEDGIPYSKVFRDYKGDGNEKFINIFNEAADSYDFEIEAIRGKKLKDIDWVTPYNYHLVMDLCSMKAKSVAAKEISAKTGRKDIFDQSSEYPYSLYDFETKEPDGKHYWIIEWTSTSQTYFHLSIAKYNFLIKFGSHCKIILVKRVLDKTPECETFSADDVLSLNRDISMIKFLK